MGLALRTKNDDVLTSVHVGINTKHIWLVKIVYFIMSTDSTKEFILKWYFFRTRFLGLNYIFFLNRLILIRYLVENKGDTGVSADMDF